MSLFTCIHLSILARNLSSKNDSHLNFLKAMPYYSIITKVSRLKRLNLEMAITDSRDEV